MATPWLVPRGRAGYTQPVQWLTSLALSALVAGPAAAPAAAAAEGGAVTLDRIVAVVNDELILQSELDRAVDTDPFVLAELQKLGSSATPQQLEIKRRELRAEVLDQLITTQLMLAEAPRFQLTASDQDVQSYLENLAARNNMASVDELRKAVESSGQFGTWAEYKQKLREEILIYKVQNVLAAPVVTDAQVRERYRMMSKGEEAKVLALRYVFKPAQATAAAKDAALSEAKQVARRLGAGEDPAAVAESTGRPAEEQMLTRREVAPAIGDALFAGKPGEIVGPLPSGQGFVVFMIEEVKASDLVGFEEAKDGLRAQLEAEAIEKGGQELREQLRARAHIDIRL